MASKAKVRSMQRGAAKRDRSPPEVGYPGLKIIITKREQAHFSLGHVTREVFLARLAPTIQQYARAGIRKPAEVAKLLNRAGIRTSCGEPWSPRLVALLLNLLFSGTEERSIPPVAPVWDKAPTTRKGRLIHVSWRQMMNIPEKTGRKAKLKRVTPKAASHQDCDSWSQKLAQLGRVTPKKKST